MKVRNETIFDNYQNLVMRICELLILSAVKIEQGQEKMPGEDDFLYIQAKWGQQLSSK